MIPISAIRPLIYVAAVVAIILALWAAHRHIDQGGYKRGVAEVTLFYQIRDAAATKAANDKIQALQTAARDKERASALHVAEISGNYQREVTNAQTKVAELQRRVATGTLRLRDPGAVCPTASTHSRMPEAGPSASGRDGTATVELSIQTSQFLIALAGECEGLADQLRAAQAVIEADRK